MCLFMHRTTRQHDECVGISFIARSYLVCNQHCKSTSWQIKFTYTLQQTSSCNIIISAIFLWWTQEEKCKKNFEEETKVPLTTIISLKRSIYQGKVGEQTLATCMNTGKLVFLPLLKPGWQRLCQTLMLVQTDLLSYEWADAERLQGARRGRVLHDKWQVVQNNCGEEEDLYPWYWTVISVPAPLLLPEFAQIFLTVVYIHPKANTDKVHKGWL